MPVLSDGRDSASRAHNGATPLQEMQCQTENFSHEGASEGHLRQNRGGGGALTVPSLDTRYAGSFFRARAKTRVGLSP